MLSAGLFRCLFSLSCVLSLCLVLSATLCLFVVEEADHLVGGKVRGREERIDGGMGGERERGGGCLDSEKGVWVVKNGGR